MNRYIKDILIVFIVGVIILSVSIPIGFYLNNNPIEPYEPNEPYEPEPDKEFYYIEVYINFTNKAELDEFLMYDFPYGVSWDKLYIDNWFIVRTVVFQNTPYEAPNCYLEFVLWKCGLYLGYFRERFDTDEQVYDLYYCGVYGYHPIREVYLNYSLNSHRSGFLVDLVGSDLPEPTVIKEICSADTMIQRVNNPEVSNWLSYPDISKIQVGCHYLYFPDFCWESYFYFDYNGKPESFTNAKVRIALVDPSVGNEFNFSICVYLSDWTTFSNYTNYTLPDGHVLKKWLSLPNKTDFVRRFDTEYILEDDHAYLQFDITEYTNLDNLSIVLTPSIDEITPENHVYIHSTGYHFYPFKPQIIWS